MPEMPMITERAIVWVPQAYTPTWKVKIDGTEITADVLFLEFDKPATETVGHFSLKINNNDNSYSDLYSGGESVQIYIDWSDGTTLQFAGTIEKVEKVFDEELGNILKVTGMHVSGKLLDITVTRTFSDTQISGTSSSILESIISAYASDFTTTNVTACTTTASVTWSNKPLWDCIRELCEIAGYDCYVDDNKDIHFFPRNSILNTQDAAVYGDNILKVEGLKTDLIDVKNRVIVYGKDSDGQEIVYQAEDAESQSAYGIRESVIEDVNITKEEEAMEVAKAKLAEYNQPGLKGTVKCTGLIHINPGEKIWIVYPPQKIYDKYKVQNITHTIDMGFFTTTLEVSKIGANIPVQIKRRQEETRKLREVRNPYEMSRSWNFTFDDDSKSESLDNTLAISGGKLKWVGPTTTYGTFVSITKTEETDVSEVHLKVIGKDIGASFFWVSANDGLTWESIEPNSKITLRNSGKKLKIRVRLIKNNENPAPEIDSMVLLYK